MDRNRCLRRRLGSGELLLRLELGAAVKSARDLPNRELPGRRPRPAPDSFRLSRLDRRLQQPHPDSQMILYAITIFLSAFLLFQVQPLIAKIILPWFGGSAAVWAAAMLFFQLVLLAGYAYAHLMVHVGLLLVSCALLPILPSPIWRPIEAGDPTSRILLLLAATIGLPYF